MYLYENANFLTCLYFGYLLQHFIFVNINLKLELFIISSSSCTCLKCSMTIVRSNFYSYFITVNRYSFIFYNCKIETLMLKLVSVGIVLISISQQHDISVLVEYINFKETYMTVKHTDSLISCSFLSVRINPYHAKFLK